MANDQADQKKTSQMSITDDERLRYFGFDVGPSKIGKLFDSADEEKRLVDHVREKRTQHDELRDTSNFREIRISKFERQIIIGVFALALIAFFVPITPWFSGHVETVTEVVVETKLSGVADDGSGFQAVQGSATRIRIDKDYYSWSGAGALMNLGSTATAVFSSGIILMITGVLFIVYILLTFGLSGFIIYSVVTAKGDDDEIALKLKKVFRYCWAPFGIWLLMMALSMIGSDYGFDTAGGLKQLGDSYGVMTFLGLVSTGFYISLAAFTMAATKSVEI
ncbi:MAG: hypothetical protein IIB00_00650 [candidate division Zixibacteria bacterium]|nr:hypothetical protein [candidate division Zixibacteria bacterium]